MKPTWLIAVFSAFSFASAHAAPVAVTFTKVTDNVYAYVGEMGDRSKDNYGLNSNHGLVVTDKGAVLIDSGAL
jgi:hypothetical protein